MDFTDTMYHQICEKLSRSGRTAITFAELISRQADIGAHDGYIVLRHDIDRMPERALRMAKIEHQHGLTGSYYFRVPASYRPQIIQEIADLGHEIGLHYECLDKAKGDPELAKAIFCRDLEKINAIKPSKTVSMHGNPLTKFDNRDFWNHHKLEDFGLLGEVYLTTDFTKCMYFSDTGRTWDADKYNIKDVIPEGHASIERPVIKDSADLMKTLDAGRSNIYLLIHPERWSHNILSWVISFSKDMVINTIKIILKKFIKMRRTH